MVEVRLYGNLRRFAEDAAASTESIAHMPWREGDTVEAVLRRLGIDPDQEVSNIFVNGRYHYRAGGLPVSDGVRLGVFPRNMSLLYC